MPQAECTSRVASVSVFQKEKQYTELFHELMQ